jgi:hypothetical protein
VTHPSRLAVKNGERLRMTVVIVAAADGGEAVADRRNSALCGQLSRQLNILTSVDRRGVAGLIMRFS